MSDRYILEGHVPVQCEDLLKWGAWFEKNDRHVRLTRVGPHFVSTVFLGLDHNFRRTMGDETEPPILFETMVYIEMPQISHLPAIPEFGLEARTLEHGRTFLDEQERCSTWEEAEAQHEAMIEKMRHPGDEIEQIYPEELVRAN